jgi:hypothetical protein
MGTIPVRSQLSIGSNPISNTDNPAREVSDDNRKHETQNYSGWRFQDCVSSDLPDSCKNGSALSIRSLLAETQAPRA